MHASEGLASSLADLFLGAESKTTGVRGSPIKANFAWRLSQGAFGPLFERASSCLRTFFPVPDSRHDVATVDPFSDYSREPDQARYARSHAGRSAFPNKPVRL
jgi:hypothetical protein